MINKILKKFGYEKAVSRLAEILQQNSPFLDGSLGEPQPENYDKYLKAYADELWVYVCVFTIANTIAGLPWKIVNGKTRKESEGNGAKVLFENPNKNDENSTWNNMIEFIAASMDLTGNGYLLHDEIIGKKPTSLQPLIASRVAVKPGADRYIDKYMYMPAGKNVAVPFEPEEISHFKYISVNNYYYGQAASAPARWSVNTLKESIKTNLNIFKNGARLDGVLQTEQALGDKVYNRLEEQFKQKYSGTDKAHKTPILEKGLSYKTIVGSMKDLEFIKGTKLNREEVCAAYGVPPLIVGILDKATYSNYKESNIIFYKNTIIPKLKKIAPVFTAIVKLFNPADVFEFDLSKVEALQVDQKAVSEIAKTYFGLGIPINDIIAKLELPFEKVKGGDIGYLPFNLAPVGSSVPSPEEDGKHLKAIKESKKDILWKRFSAMERRIEKAYMKMIERYFSKQEASILARMGKSKATIDIESVLFNEQGEITKWAKESKKIHTVSLDENGKREMANLGVEVAFDVTNPSVVKWINKYGLEKSTEVIGNLREEVKTSLVAGLKEGESIPNLKKRITDIYTPYKKEGYKATRIARTEVVGASNQGALESYKQSGVVKKKGWLSSRSADSRDWHVAAESQYAKGIPIDEDFTLSNGSSGPAPGQMGAAEDDCNCECTVYAIVED